MSSDTSLYSRLLFAARHGYPLPHPQPFDDLPRREGIEIGDVGAVTSDGSFDVFFNIRQIDDPVNRFGLPEDFEPVPLHPYSYASRPTHYGPGSHVSNSKLRTRRLGLNVDVDSNALIPVGVGNVIDISSSAERTAVLLLQEGASRTDLRFSEIFGRQAKKHGENWYEFVRGLGYPLDNGDLYLVTGVDKSTLWNVSATEKHTGNDNISLKLRAMQIGTLDGSYRWEWEYGGQFSDSGPRRPTGEALDLCNQTVFLRGFKIMLNSALFEKQKRTKAISVAESKPSSILKGRGFLSFLSRWTHGGSGGITRNAYVGDTKNKDSAGNMDDDESTSVSYFPMTYKQYHPADSINAHMLAFSSDVSVAVTHDDEWMSVLEKEEEEVPEDAELIQRILLKYSVKIESSCASLKPRATHSRTEQGDQHTELSEPSPEFSISETRPQMTDIQETHLPPEPSPLTNPLVVHDRRGGFGGEGERKGGHGGRGVVATEDRVFRGISVGIDDANQWTLVGGEEGHGGEANQWSDNTLVGGPNITGGIDDANQWSGDTMVERWSGATLVESGIGARDASKFAKEAQVLSRVPVVPVDEFCEEYGLSKEVRVILDEKEFKTAGALFELSDAALKEAGFKSDQIAELKRALREFLVAANSGKITGATEDVRIFGEIAGSVDSLAGRGSGEGGFGGVGQGSQFVKEPVLPEADRLEDKIRGLLDETGFI